jgi:hypothetical protein
MNVKIVYFMLCWLRGGRRKCGAEIWDFSGPGPRRCGVVANFVPVDDAALNPLGISL